MTEAKENETIISNMEELDWFLSGASKAEIALFNFFYHTPISNILSFLQTPIESNFLDKGERELFFENLKTFKEDFKKSRLPKKISAHSVSTSTEYDIVRETKLTLHLKKLIKGIEKQMIQYLEQEGLLDD